MKRSTKRKIQKHLQQAGETVTKAGEALRPAARNGAGKAVVAAAGIAALGAAGVVTARALRQRRSNGAEPGTTFRLEADAEGGWILTRDGGDDQRFGNKRQALRAARDVAASAHPSRLIIHRTDGRVQRTHTY
ncbi:MAG: DUF2188 domain-containing protein [Gemmatimonadota bacterium]